MKKDGGWLLPEVIDPPATRCVQLLIPDDVNHIRAFWGALYNLTMWNNWQRDELKQGKDAARVWYNIWLAAYTQFFTGEECEASMFDVRQNTESPCTLEKTADGLIWTPWADLQLCPPKIRKFGGKTQYSTDDGVTWVDIEDPYAEPVYTNPPPPIPQLPPPGPTRNCAAAANAATGYYKLAHELAKESDEQGEIFFIIGQFANYAAPFLNFSISAEFFEGLSSNTAFQSNVNSALLAMEAEAITAGKTLGNYIRDNVNSATLHALQCSLYCASDADGNIDFATALDTIDTYDVFGASTTPLKQMVTMMGSGGLAALQSARAVTTYDCGDCACVPDCGEVAVQHIIYARGTQPAPYGWVGFAGSQSSPCTNGVAWFGSDQILELLVGDGGRCLGTINLAHYRQSSSTTPPSSMEYSINGEAWQACEFSSGLNCNYVFGISNLLRHVTSVRWRFSTANGLCFVNRVVLVEYEANP